MTELAKEIILCVFSETLDQLAILKFINGWSEDDQTLVEYKTIEEQCNSVPSDDVLPSDTIDLVDFRRDCAFVESTIRKTFNEIRDKGTYESLSSITYIFKRLQKEERELLEDTRKKEEEYVKLQNEYYANRMEFRRNIDDLMSEIGKFKDEIEDFEQEADIKTNYLKSWLNSKSELSEYVFSHKENDIAEVIQERQHDFTKEHRVHQEVKNIYNEIDMDYQKQLGKWKIKYEYDLAAISAKISDLQEKRERQQEKTAQMIKTYIKRQEEIDSYQDYKKEQEKKRLEKERKDGAATKIQAWWRGTMVRKGFGKYKKKDKKGKKKGDDKKKK